MEGEVSRNDLAVRRQWRTHANGDLIRRIESQVITDTSPTSETFSSRNWETRLRLSHLKIPVLRAISRSLWWTRATWSTPREGGARVRRLAQRRRWWLSTKSRRFWTTGNKVAYLSMEIQLGFFECFWRFRIRRRTCSRMTALSIPMEDGPAW